MSILKIFYIWVKTERIGLRTERMDIIYKDFIKTQELAVSIKLNTTLLHWRNYKLKKLRWELRHCRMLTWIVDPLLFIIKHKTTFTSAHYRHSLLSISVWSSNVGQRPPLYFSTPYVIRNSHPVDISLFPDVTRPSQRWSASL